MGDETAEELRDPDRTDAVAGRMGDAVARSAERRSDERRGGTTLRPDLPAEEVAAGEEGGERFLALDVLSVLLPEAAATFHAALNEACRTFDISTPLRIAHFFAQTAHESADYTALVENLNYGAPGLQATWPSRFDAARAAEYARQPEKIANYVYADRMGNGPESSGDGWRFRGRGILQLTGRATYAAVGEALAVDLEAQPDELTTPRLAALAAGWYWQARGINALSDRDDAIAVTEAVNGGRHGLEHRLELLSAAKAVLLQHDIPA